MNTTYVFLQSTHFVKLKIYLAKIKNFTVGLNHLILWENYTYRKQYEITKIRYFNDCQKKKKNENIC